MSLVDLAYRRAKAVKAKKKAVDAGKIVMKAGKKPKHSSQSTQSRTEEMRELFESDMSERKQRRNNSGAGKKKSKHSFKSKSRYETDLNLVCSCCDSISLKRSFSIHTRCVLGSD